MQQGAGAFATLAAFDDSALESVRWGEAGQRLRVVSVSPEFFPALGMQPAGWRVWRSVDARRECLAAAGIATARDHQ